LHEYHFRFQEMEGMGLGAVATKDFEPGELVLAEKPVLAIRTMEGGDEWENELNRQFDQLSAEGQAEVWKLHDACLQKPEKSLNGILFTNCIGRDPQARFDAALFLQLSRFNHSCSPNLEQSWDEDAGQAHLIAAEPIKAGDELFTHYVELRLPREERRQRLHESYGFWCNCSKDRACAKTDWAESDRRRNEMKRLDEQIKKTKGNPERGLQLVKKLLKLYDKEGLHVAGFRKWNCLSAMEFALHTGDVASAQRWARKGYDYSRLAHGSQHRDTRWLAQLKEDPSSHPAFEHRFESVKNQALYAFGVAMLVVVGTVYYW